MQTRDRLAEALNGAGLIEMADRALSGYYDEFTSPLDLPLLTLAGELAVIGTPQALALRGRVMDGDFDATLEESDQWAESPEGQETLGKLVRDR